MSQDRYTKVVLTVIAGCLLWICVRDLNPISEAFAQGAKSSDVINVKIVDVDLGYGRTLPVKTESSSSHPIYVSVVK